MNSLDCFAGGGATGALMRSFDWAATTLGPVDGWPPSLCVNLNTCLNTAVPTVICWGPDLVTLYNDAYGALLGARHPAAIGQVGRECWKESWETMEPLLRGVLRAGEQAWSSDVMVALERRDFLEECYFTFAYSPVRDETGAVAGVVVAAHETTKDVLSARRFGTLRQLGDRLGAAGSAREVWTATADVLAANPHDVPFAALYAADGGNARLVSSCGLNGSSQALSALAIADATPFWPLDAAQRGGAVRAAALAPGVAADLAAAGRAPSHEALVLRVNGAGGSVAGFLVAGFSARLPVDDAYEGFLRLVATQVGAALSALPSSDGAREAKRALYSEFMQAPVAISVLVGPGLVIDLANARYERMVGRTMPVGRPFREAFPELPDDAPIFAVLQRVYAGEEYAAEDFALALRRPDGTMEDRRFAFRCEPLRDGAGQVFGIMTVAEDTTAQARALQEAQRASADLRATQSRLRAAVEAGSVGTWHWDVEQDVLRADGLLAEIFGLSPDDAARGLPLSRFTEAIEPEDRERVMMLIRKAVAQGGEYAADYRVRDTTGKIRWVAARGRVERDAQGQARALPGALSDISDRRQAAQALQEASRVKDEFLAMLGHELRNPLSPILTALHLMRLRAPDSVVRERTIIERQVGHLVRLVDDLLDVSRITRGKVELDRAPVEAAELVDRAIEIASPLLEQKQQHLTVDVARGGLVVDVDAARLAQAVANLLTNASKFTEVGGAIWVKAEASGDGKAVISVRDAGSGISADMLPRVFDLFTQERQQSDRSQGGLGLGLSIVRSLVEMHGGHASAHSEGPGRGSEFTITLPLSTRPLAASVAAPKAAGRSRLHARRVLVVDDNRDAAALLDEALEAQGHEVRVAFDGPQALALVEGFTPDVALLDIGLPVMDGYELARRLGALPHLQGTVMFAITGYGQMIDRKRSEEAGFAAHIVKPVDVLQLSAAIGKVPRAVDGREDAAGED